MVNEIFISVKQNAALPCYNPLNIKGVCQAVSQKINSAHHPPPPSSVGTVPDCQSEGLGFSTRHSGLHSLLLKCTQSLIQVD